MSKTITLSLKKDLIFEAVKADTFQRAQADKSDNPVANAARAYCESAGDESYHLRKLLRNLRSGLAKFATMMNEFVDTENGSITYTLSDSSNEITIVIIVTDRYSNGLAQPLASLAEDYIVYCMNSDWWQQFQSDLSKDYYERANNTLDFIRLCLAKTAPSAGTGTYADITGTVTNGSNSGSNSGSNNQGDQSSNNTPTEQQANDDQRPDASEQHPDAPGTLIQD